MLEILICLGIALGIIAGVLIVAFVYILISENKDEEWVTYLKIGFAIVAIIILMTLLVYKCRHPNNNKNTKQETSIKIEDRR